MSILKNLGSTYQTELCLKAFKALANPDRFNIALWLLEPKKNFFSEKIDIEKEVKDKEFDIPKDVELKAMKDMQQMGGGRAFQIRVGG